MSKSWLENHIVIYFTLAFTLQYFTTTKIQAHYHYVHDGFCAIITGILVGYFLDLTGKRSLIAIFSPIFVSISLFIIVHTTLMDFLPEPLILISIGKFMCIVLYFSSLPALISPNYIVLGTGFAYSFVESITFLGSKVVTYTDTKYAII